MICCGRTSEYQKLLQPNEISKRTNTLLHKSTPEDHPYVAETTTARPQLEHHYENYSAGSAQLGLSQAPPQSYLGDPSRLEIRVEHLPTPPPASGPRESYTFSPPNHRISRTPEAGKLMHSHHRFESTSQTSTSNWTPPPKPLSNLKNRLNAEKELEHWLGVQSASAGIF